jgi:hypothetical protein
MPYRTYNDQTADGTFWSVNSTRENLWKQFLHVPKPLISGKILVETLDSLPDPVLADHQCRHEAPEYSTKLTKPNKGDRFCWPPSILISEVYIFVLLK